MSKLKEYMKEIRKFGVKRMRLFSSYVRDTFAYTADERSIRKFGRGYRRYIRSLRGDDSK